MKKVLAIVVLFVLLLGGGFFGIKYYLDSQYKSQIEALTALANTTQEPETIVEERVVEKEVVISAATIEAGLNDIGKLCTAEYYFTHVSSFDSSKKVRGFTIPGTKSSFVYSYDGVILAGVDFAGITVEKNEDEKTITVLLPKAEIISSDVDQNSFKLYDEKNNIFNPISVSDVTDSFADLKNDEEKKAVNAGLLDRAKENAVLLVQNFLKGSYSFDDYTITVKEK